MKFTGDLTELRRKYKIHLLEFLEHLGVAQAGGRVSLREWEVTLEQTGAADNMIWVILKKI